MPTTPRPRPDRAPQPARTPVRLTRTGRAVVATGVGVLALATVAGAVGLMSPGDATAAGDTATAGSPLSLASDRVPDGAGSASDPAVPVQAVSPRPLRVKVTSISTADGGEYGVGMPIVVRFDRPIPESARAAVQSAATVVTDRDTGPASWSWPMSTMLAYRPKGFWPANTTVHLHVGLAGRPLGTTLAGRPLVGADEQDLTFTIGRRQVTEVDLASQGARVVRDGGTVRWVPVSTGADGFDTRSGTKIILGEEPNKVFTGDSFDEDYELVAKYALRITDTGEYLHSAPWAADRLGRYPGSHGCTNISDADGRWFMDNSLVGDPVIYAGDPSAPPMEPLNGLGGLWNIPWSRWTDGTANTSDGQPGRATA